MFGTHDLWLFVLSGLHTLFIVGRSSDQGWRAGTVAALGNGTVWNLLIAWSTARLTRRLGVGDLFKKWFNRCVGSLLVFVGFRLALAHDR